MNFKPILTIYLLSLVPLGLSLSANNFPFYVDCTKNCVVDSCTSKDGARFKNGKAPTLIHLWWSCKDNCKYVCMWDVLKHLKDEGVNEIPQFNGKWPFVRFLGIQEPASVLFSLLNLYTNVGMLKKFRKEVKKESPMYYLWHLYVFIAIHAWVWSTIFHIKDTHLTELMDYTSAYSVVLMTCYLAVYRIFVDKSYPVKAFITTFFLAFYINHIKYLTSGRIDYGYNMEVNLATGFITAVLWFYWSMWNRHRLPYVWNCAAFVVLTALTASLEVFDRPPFLFVLDPHSIWHLLTAPIICLFYRFAISDCQFLNKLKAAENKESKDLGRKVA